ncbi:MAG: hypothetical protein J6X69_01960 [Bacteroidales bacterium]|nr:hypothetical protein [Bacteroidales bacterium]
MRVCKTITIPGNTSLTGLYAEKVGNYPKFFKMDTLSKLGFLATELLLEGEADRFISREDRAVLLFSRSGSVCDDSHFAKSMEDYPSPSLFVYTLPNIVAGEIAIRNNYRGETSAFVLEQYDKERIRHVVEEAFQDRTTRSAIVGWVDVRSDTDWTCEVSLIEK